MKFKIINLNKSEIIILFKHLICKMKVNTSQINITFTKNFCVYVLYIYIYIYIYIYAVLQKQKKKILSNLKYIRDLGNLCTAQYVQ